MKRSWRYHVLLASLWMLVRAASATPNAPAEVFSLAFSSDTARLARESVLRPPVEWPAWITGLEQFGGGYLDSPGAWVVDKNLSAGIGRFTISLDRSTLVGDLALTLVYEEQPDSDFAVQLLDARGRVVAVDLFSNIITAGREARTDTFIIPLSAFPGATQISLRRISGPVRVYGLVIFPVAPAEPAVGAEGQALADRLGDLLSPENPLVREADQIASAQRKNLAWNEAQIRIEKPLEQVNQVGQVALSVREYPEYSPALDSVTGEYLLYASGTTYEFITDCVHRLTRYYPGVRLETFMPSSAGVAQGLLQDITLVGAMSRPLSAAEQENFYQQNGYPLLEMPLALDAIQILVNEQNPLAGLSVPQLDAVFGQQRLSGTPVLARVWGDLGLGGEWKEAPIEVYGGDGSFGTSLIFKNLVLQGGSFRPDLREDDVVFPGGVESDVSTHPYAIGYASLRPRNSTVKVLPVARLSGQPYQALRAKEIYEGDYPLTRQMFLYVNARSARDLPPALREFLALLFSREGQTEVAKTGSLPLDARQVKKSRAVLDL